MSIIPWAFGTAGGASASATEFVTYTANGIKPLDFSSTNNEYATGITSGTDSQNNVRIYNSVLAGTYIAGTKSTH